MANEEKVIVTKSKLDALATSISTKSGQSLPMTIAQMKSAVDGISGGSISITDVANSTGITCVITTGTRPEPSGTWEILYPNTGTQFIPNGEDEPGSYCWISQLGDTPFVVGDQYRITYDGTSYEVTAHANAKYGAAIGDESWVDTPIWLFCAYGAWIGTIEPKAEARHLLQVEHFVSD